MLLHNNYKNQEIMKFGLLSFRVSLWVLCCFFMTVTTGWSQEQEHAESYTGTEVTLGAIFSLSDPELNSGLTTVDIGNTAFVKVEVLDNTGPFFKFEYTIKLRVTPVLTSGPQASYIKTLEIAYDPYTGNGDFRDVAFHALENAYGVHLQVMEVTTVNQDTSGPASGSFTPDNVRLSLGFRTQRYYEYTATTPSPSINLDAEGLETIVSWSALSPTSGILNYELEWTWVDNYETNSPADIRWTDRDFQINSTRVETANNSYSIPLIYGNGYLMYRVRGVGRFLDNLNQPYYGAWSSGSNAKNTVDDWPNVLISAHEQDDKNWQFQASYAEEGKKKEVVSYFDGTLRNRQTVTRINSDDNAIVGEVIYDVQGRPAIEVLPVPVLETDDNRLKYYEDFNQNTTGEVYSSYDFDWEPPVDPTDPNCGTDAGNMNVISGASEYYGPKTATGTFQDLVPDAQGFPFSQIEYTNDNTGRINRKSGVGPDHKLGTNHEMKYFYTVPTQEELNRLFGYRVGNASHYKKNVVIDPNGQVSISYIDPQGRTIATALTADNPENLEGLDDEELNALHQFLTADLLNKINPDDPDTNADNNNLYSSGNYGALSDGLKYEAQKVFTADGAQYTFDYQVDGSQAFANGCMDPTLGYPFVYKLHINVVDECGNSMIEGGAIERNIGEVPDFQTLSDPPLLNTVSTTSTFTETALIQENLNTGTYNVIKDLYLDDEALELYADDYIKLVRNA